MVTLKLFLGIIVRTTGEEKYAKKVTSLLVPLCDKANAVFGELELKDQISFFIIKTTENDYMIHFGK